MNIFQIETAALAHVACTPWESGIFLTDFASAYPSVNHSWIFHVLEKKTDLPEFTCRFLRRIYHDSTTHVESARTTGGQFLMDRGVRQGCPASGFLFGIAFDPFFRWLQDSIIPRNPAGLDFLQPVPCAYADDLAVGASSFRCLMSALAPAFQIMDQIAGLNLNHRKCCWVQYGRESCQSLFDWVATNCEEFREMKVVKYAKYVGIMIGPEGNAHRWTAPRKKSFSVFKKLTLPPKALLRDSATFRSMPFLCWSILDPYPRQTRPPSRLRQLPYSSPPQAHTMPSPPTYYVLVPCAALDLTWLGSTLSAFRPAIELPRVRTRSAKALRRFRQLVGMTLLQFWLSAPTGNRYFWLFPWLVALRRPSILYVAWTAAASLMILHRTTHGCLFLASRQNYMSKTLPDQSLHVPPKFLDDQSVSQCGNSASHETCVARRSSWTHCWLFT